jgi:hypothetical protein
MHIVELAMSAAELAPVKALVLKSQFLCQRDALVIRRNNPNKDPFEVELAKREIGLRKLPRLRNPAFAMSGR